MKHQNVFILSSPGNIFLQDLEEMSLGDALKFKQNRIHSWLLRIKDDMLNPLEKRFINDSIQKFREEIENKFDEIEDRYFTKEEGDELRERLEQLEKIIFRARAFKKIGKMKFQK